MCYLSNLNSYFRPEHKYVSTYSYPVGGIDAVVCDAAGG